MKTRNLILAFAAAGLLGGGGYGLYWTGMNRGMKMADPASGAAAPAAGESQQTAGKKVLYWHDPMVPGQKFDKPGKSPFMDMQLVPVYAEGDGDEGKVTISSRMQQNLGMRTAEVTKGVLAPAVEAVGSIAYNERDVAVVQARSNGFVERLNVRAPLDPVRKGQSLAELYVPEWVAAQEEYLSVRRMAGTRMDALVDGARQRMRLVGMTEEQIRMVESTGTVHPRLSVIAPIGGVVAELGAREGMTVMAGAPLFRINGLGTVWVNAEVRESQAGEVRPGNVVEARTPALPGVVFKGRVSAILPEINLATRTFKARVELANPGGKLVPGMFATVNFTPAVRKEMLLVPTEAVIQTGKRSVVVLAQGGGKFAPVDVETGIEANGQTEIRKGLEAGQKVVVSGQFLLDSEASLKSTETRMGEPAASASGQADRKIHQGKGAVISVTETSALIKHGDIPSAGMGAMTMEYMAPKSGMPKNVKAGDNIDFSFTMDKDGESVLTAITPIAGAAVKPAAPDSIKGMKP